MILRISTLLFRMIWYILNSGKVQVSWNAYAFHKILGCVFPRTRRQWTWRHPGWMVWSPSTLGSVKRFDWTKSTEGKKEFFFLPQRAPLDFVCSKRVMYIDYILYIYIYMVLHRNNIYTFCCEVVFAWKWYFPSTAPCFGVVLFHAQVSQCSGLPCCGCCAYQCFRHRRPGEP